MENARQDILVQMVLKETIESVSVSDEEVKDYYEQNKAQFVKGATVNAKHILTDSEEKCAAILESIVNGEKTFEEAAKNLPPAHPVHRAVTWVNSEKARW